MTHEHRIAEAEATLRTLLDTWHVDDSHSRAHDYITSLLRAGWRPVAPPVRPTPSRGTGSQNTAAHIATLRQALHDARRPMDPPHPSTTRPQASIDPTDRSTTQDTE